MSKRETFISVIVRVRDAESWIEAAIERIAAVLDRDFEYYELVIIDDASADGTRQAIEALQKRLRNIQLYCLARRSGDNIAIVAGLDHAIGDLVVTLDPRLDPPEIIPRMVDATAGGIEIVYGLPLGRSEGLGIYEFLFARFLRALARLNQIDVPNALSSYRLFSRSVLNFMLESANRHRTLMIAPAMSGYAYTVLEYDRLAAPPSTSRSRLIRWRAAVKAIDLIFSSSVIPLRLVTLISLGISVLTLLYDIYILLIVLLKHDVANGWASLSLEVSGLFFLVCIVLAIMGEYLAQVLQMASNRPIYQVARQAQSATMTLTRDLNVIECKTSELPPEAAEIIARFPTPSSGGL